MMFHEMSRKHTKVEYATSEGREQSPERARKVQQARKNARFNLDDRIRLELSCEGEWREAVEAHQTMIQEATLSIGVTPVG